MLFRSMSIWALEGTARRVGDEGAVMIRFSAPMVYAAYGRFEEAWAVVEDFRGTYDNRSVPYIEEGFGYLDEWLADAQAGRTPAIRDIEVPRRG